MLTMYVKTVPSPYKVNIKVLHKTLFHTVKKREKRLIYNNEGRDLKWVDQRRIQDANKVAK